MVGTSSSVVDIRVCQKVAVSSHLASVAVGHSRIGFKSNSLVLKS